MFGSLYNTALSLTHQITNTGGNLNSAQNKMLLNVGQRITMLGGDNTPVAIYEITRVTKTQAVIQKENSFVGKLDVKFKREIRGEDSLFCEYGDSGWNKKYYRYYM